MSFYLVHPLDNNCIHIHNQNLVQIMSLNMQNAVIFARWFIRSHPNADLVSLLDTQSESVWALFLASNEAVDASKTFVDNLIPKLVEKVNTNSKKPRPTKTKNPSAASVDMTPQAIVVEEPVQPLDKPKKTKKPKKEQAATIDTQAPTEQYVEPVAPVVVEEPTQPLDKPKKTKKSKKEPVAATASTEVDTQVPTEQSVEPVAVEEPAQPLDKPKKTKKSKKEQAATIDTQAPTEQSVEPEEPSVAPKQESSDELVGTLDFESYDTEEVVLYKLADDTFADQFGKLVI
jgi:hypothetical protein